MAKKAKRNLAVSDSDSDTASSSAPLAERRVASASSQGNGKGKERQRKQRKTSHNDHDDETDEESLLRNDRAGLSRNDANGMSKGKGKAMADQKEEAQDTQGKGARRKALAVDQDDNDTEEDDDAAEGSDSVDDGYITMSIGSLHDADSEDGLGEWTEDDGEKYQMDEFPEPDFIQPSDGSDGSFEVDIVIRFRWHPRRHFPQYRVKWTGYSDVFNLWEPVDSFAGGNAVEEYWKDIEHAGLQKRPKGWNKGLDSSSDAGLDSDDTERAVTSHNANKRKEARRRKRRDIRIDRVEMRKAYCRKHARKKYEEDLKKERIEQKRRKKEQEEAAAAAKKTPVKTVVNPAKVVKSIEPSRSYAASTSNGKSAESVKLATNGISNSMQSALPRPQQHQQPSRPFLASASASSPPAASIPSSSSVSDSLAIARAYMTEPDAKIRADKKKAKLDEALRKGHLSISPSSSEAEISKTAASNASASTSAVGATEEKTKGAFRGAHKNLKKIKTIEPGKPSAPAGKRWDPLSHLLPGSTLASASASAPQLTASQEAMPPPTSVPVTNSDRNGMRPVNIATAEQPMTSVPVPSSSPMPPSYASFRPMNALRNGPLRMGNDPRSSRPMVRPADHDDTSYTNGNTSPATGADNSPQHSTQSPMHVNQAAPSPVHVPPSPLHSGQRQPASPLHHTNAPQGDASRKQNGVPESYIDPATIKGLTEIEQARALDAMERWHFPDSLRKESEMSYNFQPRYQNEDQDRRRLMQHVISICKGGRPPNLLPRHMQPGKKNIVWIPSAKYPLSAMERDVLPLNNFKFIEYTEETGVLEIWPFTSRKVIMCTCGALMLKLIEHCYVVKSKQRWEVQDATIMIHPWQKAILQQLIDADMLRSFLEQILGITDDLANKEFAISESGREVLDDFEEVPSEYLNSEATGRDEPLVSELDMSDIILNVDKETYTTLHRLQYEKRQHCRFFTLIMAKTRVACSEVPTLYKVVQ